MANRQCDKMSKLEFLAIPFGVKITITWGLGWCADRVCQRNLHYFIYFENFVISCNHNIMLSLFYHFFHYYFMIILFSRSLILFLIWTCDILWKKKFSCDFIGRHEKSETAWPSAISSPLKTLKCLMCIIKHPSRCFTNKSVSRSYECQQCRRR